MTPDWASCSQLHCDSSTSVQPFPTMGALPISESSISNLSYQDIITWIEIPQLRSYCQEGYIICDHVIRIYRMSQILELGALNCQIQTDPKRISF